MSKDKGSNKFTKPIEFGNSNLAITELNWVANNNWFRNYYLYALVIEKVQRGAEEYDPLGAFHNLDDDIPF